ncbi:thrombopoietin receptor [Cheilinus undulatus]|uniref:thrombopoietin receptor n=1 Tax=Cheilinus undulatus TaxID=241271 RepID=UPI001BD6A8B9|nr:thrombopoietin receptor [Cheilinus undulatus]
MNLRCRYSLWILMGFVAGMHCQDGTVTQEDVLLLKDEKDPKCFTRTEQDFTCFFETKDDNQTYDFLYGIAGVKRCEMTVQRSKDGSVLHICKFPMMDVLLYVETHIEVVERGTNSSIYNRTIFVEDHFLLPPPFNVSLHQNGRPGQLQVSWHSAVPKYWEDTAMYEVRYSSKGTGEKTKEKAKQGDILDLLVPGEKVQAQVRVKCANDADAGHWSSWSHLAWAVVPQSPDDISLMCFTSDLKYITCEWNRSRYADQEYNVFYQMGLSKGLGWAEWTECLTDWGLTDRCFFYADESKNIKVQLTSTSAPLSRTFYTEEFTLNKSIKTLPPSHLKAAVEEGKLCLKWEAPLPSLSAHLQYEVSYQVTGREDWTTTFLRSPESSTCLDIPAGRQYSVKLRARPNGPVYSGFWSDWSDVLNGDTPTDRGLLLILCLPISVLITITILIVLFYTYHSKLKQYFWPPVPNLDKVLQGFLTEINEQKWDLPVTAKQCTEETTPSLVEIMAEDELSGVEKPSEETVLLLSSESDLSSSELADESSGSEVFPDYVTLNRNSELFCPKGNKYIHEQAVEKEGVMMKEELSQKCPSPSSEGSVCIPPYTETDFLNYSYLALAEPADKSDCKVMAVRPGNIYTNLPCC